MEEKIDLKKLVTKEEIEAIIYVLQERQKYFDLIFEEREKAINSSHKKLEELVEKTGDKELALKIDFVSRKLIKVTDDKITSSHGEELKRQPHIVEFLRKFTLDKVIDHSKTLI